MKQRDDPPLRLTFEACRSMIIRTVPPHVRQGLLRLYLVVAVPWAAWYGYQLLDAINRHRPQRYVSEAFRSLLIVPIGAPVIFVIVVWVVAGFQKSAARSDASITRKTDPTSPMPATDAKSADYYPVIARAVAGLTENTQQARQAVYDRARSVLLTQLGGQDAPRARIEREQDALEAAIEKVELEASPRSFWRRKETRKNPLKIDAKTREPLIARRGSTALLVVSLFFPRIWLIDVTCMSLWWVARLPIAGKRGF
jgi:hypothetical protein